MNKIDILTYHDRLHQPLFDIYFCPSFQQHLSQNFNLISHVDNNSSSADGSFESEHWSEILINRFDILKEYVSKNLWSEKIAIFSDIDIVFFDDIYTTIQKSMEPKDPIPTTNAIDIAYMAENLHCPHHMINGGFFAFKCSEHILRFFDHIQCLAKKQKKPNDQPVIQSYFQRENKFNTTHALLNKTEFCTNNNPLYMLNSLISTVKVFHATSATNIIEKCHVLSNIILKKDLFNHKLSLVNKNLWINQLI
jgi:hypothetical protein